MSESSLFVSLLLFLVTDFVTNFVDSLFFFLANFLAGEYGAPNWSDLLESKLDAFTNGLLVTNPDFQNDPTKNYERDAPGKANVAICAAQVTTRFSCFAGTLEQPFKDTSSEFPQPLTGWSPTRSMLLGRSLLNGFDSLL